MKIKIKLIYTSEASTVTVFMNLKVVFMFMERRCTIPDSRALPRPFGQHEPFIYDLNQRHTDTNRTLVYWLGEWDVRMSDPRSDLHRLLAVNGMLHLQMWHPESGTSVLTPSPLTDQLFEAIPLFGNQFRTRSYPEMCSVIHAAKQIEAPSPKLLMDVFFAMFTEFAWNIPQAILPRVDFDEDIAAK